MKLRLQSNTLRIRLNDQEVGQLAEGSTLVNRTTFPASELTISLNSGSQDFTAYTNDKITITVNKDRINSWASTDEVTLVMEFDVPNDKKLSILVEKDMKQ